MKTYKNQQSGMIVVSGKIKSIAEDRMVMTIVSEEYDRNQKVNNPVEYNVSTSVPYDEAYKAGYSVTAAGYQHGKGSIVAEGVFVGNEYFETQDLAIVTGLVKFARLNEEKNPDGTSKLNKQNEPKKPHFDITVTVLEDGKYVNHVIKVYEGKTEAGKKSQMDIVANLFKNFDRETNKMRVSIVTTPGQEYSYVTIRDGQEYVNFACSHMGYRSLDVEFIDDKEKTKNTPTAGKSAPAPAPAQEQPSGFDADLSMDEDEMFK